MIIDNLFLKSEKDTQEFVYNCEGQYLSDVEKACSISKNSSRIITLCGPTCSGKTTTALILDDKFKECSMELHTISIDDFYFDRETLGKRSRQSGEPLDYDSPSTIDIELFAKVIEDIEAGGKVTLPKFDFKSGRRTGMEEIYIKKSDIFLFEGIQAVYPELTQYLKGHSYTSLFISVEEPLIYNDIEFSARTLRFFRRLVRDARTRNASAEFTFSLWESVVNNEKKHIYPNLEDVDFRINSMMGYEVSVIKPFVLPLLESISEGSIYKDEAIMLSEKFKEIPTIDEKFLPVNSVFREFIGERTKNFE